MNLSLSLLNVVTYYAKSGGTVRSVDVESQATSVCVYVVDENEIQAKMKFICLIT